MKNCTLGRADARIGCGLACAGLGVRARHGADLASPGARRRSGATRGRRGAPSRTLPQRRAYPLQPRVPAQHKRRARVGPGTGPGDRRQQLRSRSRRRRPCDRLRAVDRSWWWPRGNDARRSRGLCRLRQPERGARRCRAALHGAELRLCQQPAQSRHTDRRLCCGLRASLFVHQQRLRPTMDRQCPAGAARCWQRECRRPQRRAARQRAQRQGRRRVRGRSDQPRVDTAGSRHWVHRPNAQRAPRPAAQLPGHRAAHAGCAGEWRVRHGVPRAVAGRHRVGGVRRGHRRWRGSADSCAGRRGRARSPRAPSPPTLLPTTATIRA